MLEDLHGEETGQELEWDDSPEQLQLKIDSSDEKGIPGYHFNNASPRAR